MMDYQKLDAIIDASKDQLISAIRRLVAIPSVKAPAAGKNAPFGAEIRRALDEALAIARETGLTVRDYDGYAMDATCGEGPEELGILAHLDVVPIGDGWTKNPLGGEIADGKLYGRGATDDKGPAMIALFALKAIREAGIPLKNQVRVILGCDEESGSEDMAYYNQHADRLPDYAFSPDAEYPVINIEKGGLGMVIVKTVPLDETARVPVYELFAGVRVNIVPGQAYAEISTRNIGVEALKKEIAELNRLDKMNLSLEIKENGRARLSATGLQAHASHPELGVNAASMLMIALKGLRCGGAMESYAACIAETVGFDGDGKKLGADWRDEESGASTCNLGLLRYDANGSTEASADLDIRFAISTDIPTVCGRSAMTLSRYGCSLRYGGHREPHYIPKEHKLVQGLLKAYGEVTGLPAHTIAIGGGTYAHTMENAVAFGTNFPGDEDTCHIADEYIRLDRMMLSVKIMARAICELAGA